MASKIQNVWEPANVEYLEEAEQELNRLFRGTGLRLYGTVTWVNRDGTSRAVKLMTVDNGLGELRIREVSYAIARVLGCKIGHGGVIVYGSGMSPLDQIKQHLNYKCGFHVEIESMSESI
ncbi:hypothetical protein PBI_DAMIEN_43 [Mycobacterium phage Damien]|uniref:hypothetical protein n=1 Tax=Mycobacterium phage Damien TaxID=1486469 RepID=UPI00045F7460|nr:hypothetical protein HL12_gp43 [Mycobacterium phage Damien]AHZ95404.1 hypothetical protein PBI_DAMIEN_43 [Mycobacterium phage Damien]